MYPNQEDNKMEYQDLLHHTKTIVIDNTVQCRNSRKFQKEAMAEYYSSKAHGAVQLFHMIAISEYAHSFKVEYIQVSKDCESLRDIIDQENI
jgi:hypothetical protein